MASRIKIRLVTALESLLSSCLVKIASAKTQAINARVAKLRKQHNDLLRSIGRSGNDENTQLCELRRRHKSEVAKLSGKFLAERRELREKQDEIVKEIRSL